MDDSDKSMTLLSEQDVFGINRAPFFCRTILEEHARLYELFFLNINRDGVIMYYNIQISFWLRNFD